jgi:hypothetical protein
MSMPRSNNISSTCRNESYTSSTVRRIISGELLK